MNNIVEVLSLFVHQIKFLSNNGIGSVLNLFKTVSEWKPEIIFVLPYRDYPHWRAVQYAAKTVNAITLLYNMDDQSHWGNKEFWAADRLAPHYDWVITTYQPGEKSPLARYRKIGCKRVVPVTFGVDLHKARNLNLPRETALGFYGVLTRQRLEDIVRLQNAGMPRVRCVAGVSYKRYVELINRTRMCLNLTRTYVNKPDFKARIVEYAAGGTFIISQRLKGESIYLTPKKEMVSYETPHQAVKLASYYLTHDSEREKIAEAGQKRAIRDHDQQTIFERVFASIKKGKPLIG